MDREKVISTFEKTISVCKEDGCDFVDLSFEDAEQILALLEKQIPKTPPEFWDCPSCGTSISTWNNPIIHYCYYCGQAVKWE